MNFLIPPGSLIALYGAEDENRIRIPNGTQALIVKWVLEGRVTWQPVVLINQQVKTLEKLTGAEWERLIEVIEFPAGYGEEPDQ